MTENTAEYGRNPDGTFATGNPGRPPGARHKATRAILELLEANSTELAEKAIQMALDGDMVAMRLCIERIAPARKDAPVAFELPEMKSAHDAAQAAGSVLDAVAGGELTPLEGASVMGLVETYRRTFETSELERRVEDLEKTK